MSGESSADLGVAIPAIAPRADIQQGDVEEALAALPEAEFDLCVSSPPYNLGKIYERGQALTLPQYAAWQSRVADELTRVMKPNSSICWQVGNYVTAGELFPLDMVFYDIFKKAGWTLRNRIIWRFNFGLNATRRLSGRYETLLWFTRGDYKFNLDDIRIPQLYPGKRHPSTKGDKAGRLSGNPKGKNPADFWEFSPRVAFLDDPVWEIPNVKAKHLEQTDHPCQFPIELAERCVLAFTAENDKVIDPFLGSGTTAIASIKHNRSAVGIDKEAEYVDLARERIAMLEERSLPMRPSGKPPRVPRATEAVAKLPNEWRKAG